MFRKNSLAGWIVGCILTLVILYVTLTHLGHILNFVITHRPPDDGSDQLYELLYVMIFAGGGVTLWHLFLWVVQGRPDHPARTAQERADEVYRGEGCGGLVGFLLVALVIVGGLVLVIARGPP